MTVYTHDGVATVARRAHANGRSMSVAVAEHYGITHGAAKKAITRARNLGFNIPLRQPPPTRKPPVDDTRWKLFGACRDMDPADADRIFFPHRGASLKPAKAICATCPARVACLTYAMNNGEKFGIWGGLSEKERRRIRRKRNLAVAS